MEETGVSESGGYEIQVWTANPLTIKSWQWPRLTARLDQAERDRALKFRTQADRRAYLLAHALRREALSATLKVPPDAVAFEYAGNGRPALSKPVHRKVFFSLSHTRQLVVCAVTSMGPLGIDAEPLEPKHADLDLLSGFMTLPESDQRATALGDNPVRQFFFYWTVLEAYWKARGTGLSSSAPPLRCEKKGEVYEVCTVSETPARPPALAIPVHSPPDMIISMVLDRPPANLGNSQPTVSYFGPDDLSWDQETSSGCLSRGEILPGLPLGAGHTP